MSRERDSYEEPNKRQTGVQAFFEENCDEAWEQICRTFHRPKLWIGMAVTLLVIVLAVVLVDRGLFVKPVIKTETPSGESAEPGIDYGDGVQPTVGGERKSKDYYTVLVLGRDTGGGGNTDTMLLASYDVTNQKASVMSIPRDTMVNVNWDVKKINSVYNMNGGGDKGIKALYKEVAQLVGFEPDYQVVVEWEAVGKIVDAIGGVYFDVPYDMYYHDPYQDLVIEQTKGYRLLDGEDAMQVIRWRKNDKGSPYGYTEGIGDSGRMEVQQAFLKAVIKQMLQAKNVLNIGKISKVFQENVETDLSFQNILWFGKQALSGGLSVEDVTFLTMPWTGTAAYSRTYSRQLGRAFYLDYVVPISSKLLDIVNNQLSPFKQVFTLKDLDIMFVNSDGSIGSTTGYVEDTKAASPPQISKPAETEPGEDEPLIDENGNPITDVTDPTQPTDPTVPTDPTQSTDPTVPTDPTQSTDPTIPTDQTQPTDPTVPDDQTQSAEDALPTPDAQTDGGEAPPADVMGEE